MLPDFTAAKALSTGKLVRLLPDWKPLGSFAEHVYAMVIGDQVDHLHVHLLPRYPGTPREYWWDQVDEWPAARRGLEPEITELVQRLRASLPARA